MTNFGSGVSKEKSRLEKEFDELAAFIKKSNQGRLLGCSNGEVKIITDTIKKALMRTVSVEYELPSAYGVFLKKAGRAAGDDDGQVFDRLHIHAGLALDGDEGVESSMPEFNTNTDRFVHARANGLIPKDAMVFAGDNGVSFFYFRVLEKISAERMNDGPPIYKCELDDKEGGMDTPDQRVAESLTEFLGDYIKSWLKEHEKQYEQQKRKELRRT